jgi:putative FmdB family regulatory protein
MKRLESAMNAAGLGQAAQPETPFAPARRLWYRTALFRPMPTYEYHCEKCGKNFDVFQSMKDAALTTCPRELCQQKTWGKGRVKRLLGTGAGVIFKGSGFYSTDYRSNSYKESAKKESGAPAKTESSPAKPETSAPKSDSPKKKD